MKYKAGDIVLVKSIMVPAMRPIQVKLIKKHVVKERKGNKLDWPGYVGWDAVLIRKTDALRLKKRWQIPFKFPNDIETFVFEEEIIKRV